MQSVKQGPCSGALCTQLFATQPFPSQVAKAHVLMVDASGEHALLQAKHNAVGGSWTLATTLSVDTFFFSSDADSVDMQTLGVIQDKVWWQTRCSFAHYKVFAHSKGVKEG